MKTQVSLDDVVRWYRQVFRQHADAYVFLQRIEAALRAPMLQEDRADIALILHKSYEYLDDTRKHIERAKQLAFDTACVVWCSQTDAARSIRGKYGLATPDVNSVPKWPKQRENPEAYDAMMRWVGLDPNCEAIRAGAMSPHWNRMQEYATKLVRELKPLPKGVSLTDLTTVYKLTLRQRLDPLTDETVSGDTVNGASTEELRSLVNDAVQRNINSSVDDVLYEVCQDLNDASCPEEYIKVVEAYRSGRRDDHPKQT